MADANGHDWYHNLRAPIGRRRSRSAASVTAWSRASRAGGERERIRETQKERFPRFAGYERSTARRIPVVILVRA